MELEQLVLMHAWRGGTAESSFKEDRLSARGAALVFRTSATSCEEHWQVWVLLSSADFPLPFASGTK